MEDTGPKVGRGQQGPRGAQRGRAHRSGHEGSGVGTLHPEWTACS